MRTVLLLVVVTGSAGCSGWSGRPVTFVVPKGRTGPVWVIHDPAAPDLPSDGRGYRAAFPPGGVLLVGSLRAFDRYEVTPARYDDGTPLPQLIRGMTVSPEAIGLWGGWSGRAGPERREYIVWFVGTETQFQAFREDGHDPPPANE